MPVAGLLQQIKPTAAAFFAAVLSLEPNHLPPLSLAGTLSAAFADAFWTRCVFFSAVNIEFTSVQDSLSITE